MFTTLSILVRSPYNTHTVHSSQNVNIIQMYRYVPCFALEKMKEQLF